MGRSCSTVLCAQKHKITFGKEEEEEKKTAAAAAGLKALKPSVSAFSHQFPLLTEGNQRIQWCGPAGPGRLGHPDPQASPCHAGIKERPAICLKEWRNTTEFPLKRLIFIWGFFIFENFLPEFQWIGTVQSFKGNLPANADKCCQMWVQTTDLHKESVTICFFSDFGRLFVKEGALGRNKVQWKCGVGSWHCGFWISGVHKCQVLFSSFLWGVWTCGTRDHKEAVEGNYTREEEMLEGKAKLRGESEL